MAAAAVQSAIPSSGFNSVQGVQFQPQLDQQTTYKSIPKHDVNTILNFFKDNEDGSPPAPTYVGKPETYTNRPIASHQVTIHDVAGEEDKYTLDKSGFQFHRHTSIEKDFLDDDQIKAKYYPETEQLLKDVTGASKIFIFDHTIRRHNPDDTTTSANSDAALRGPVQRVHIDQSYTAAASRVPFHLPEEAEELSKGRVQIINVWRPIKQVQRDPLAVAEAESVVEEDLVPIGLIYPNRNGETLSVRYNEGHRWFYKSGLTPEEVLLIKCFDSKTDGRARRVPHTAFSDSTSPASAPTRESIEVRALVFHPDDRE
ncbi:hypothetical protein N5P37_002567 [Trichoderma harzianum]|uniref:Methyltransferase n=2 Tax=Trichoderma TaxID=5543 RepID=A0A2T4AFS4_TRIHA|nr:hypothetical protein M431DRAFT_413949 [Trichoderma harzianum CBS 226.95]XP_056030814.1 hypothetical protein T069G_02712 [Trichoderma breve]KAJ4861758.1 hypothetical protein T069G_02712 [Trichoderma breve]KAK0765090.1 hypothetical protein N5P37_002567 [Trichoderma harzianum]PTB55945.1 hypothetical protein M431DRAFT_413949 [Trichoderma harzianum CBS 226.95]